MLKEVLNEKCPVCGSSMGIYEVEVVVQNQYACDPERMEGFTRLGKGCTGCTYKQGETMEWIK